MEDQIRALENELFIQDQALLEAIAETNNYSLSGHNSKTKIEKRLPREYKIGKSYLAKMKRKSWKKLLGLGLIVKHPTRGEITYELSRIGLIIALRLRRE